MASNNRSRRIDPLAMQIYAALLGNPPKVAKNPQTQSRFSLKLRVESSIKTSVESPFHTPSIKESIERAAADAIGALSDAGDRLRRSRARVNRAAAAPISVPPEAATESTVKPKPIVLIGPAAIRGSQRMAVAKQAHESRQAEAARRSAAA